MVGPDLKPGSSLIREWGGQRHEVAVTHDGFAYQGEAYASLSQVAGKITGTKWNGPLFFGLRKAKGRGMMASSLRCAIYTRKSSEEGLEQGFNSLHAQREACEAYVLSQAGEGWTALTAEYDDGGFSGGSMERPGLQALLADIRRGLIDVVVVYKVDRLTRSLADFARIVELFDSHGVSFVSVTQAFNTTTSMGRLTLNVLLSFAQFEREVTGERIRDKIAASKAKGMWMGGRPPLGYDARDRKLVVNGAEAEIVRAIFHRYLELGSVITLERDLKDRQVHSKRWINAKGQAAGGAPLARGALYYLLANPVYRGAIRHKERLYPNAHPAIIDEPLWDAVQAKLAGNCPDHPKTPRLAADVLLRGRLFDDRGEPLCLVHTCRGAKRYRYYARTQRNRSPIKPVGSVSRIAVGVIDTFVIAHLAPLLSRGWRPDDPIEARVRDALLKVILGEDRVVMLIRNEAIVAHTEVAGQSLRQTDEGVELAIAVRLKHRHGAILIEGPADHKGPAQIDKSLVRAISLARAWAAQLSNGAEPSTRALAKAAGLCNRYAGQLLPLAWLAPDLVEEILAGRQPRALTLRALIDKPLPMEWDEQRAMVRGSGLGSRWL